MTGEELKRRIEIADRVLWETRRCSPWHWRDRDWLERERAHLERELEAESSK